MGLKTVTPVRVYLYNTKSQHPTVHCTCTFSLRSSEPGCMSKRCCPRRKTSRRGRMQCKQIASGCFVQRTRAHIIGIKE